MSATVTVNDLLDRLWYASPTKKTSVYLGDCGVYVWSNKNELYSNKNVKQKYQVKPISQMFSSSLPEYSVVPVSLADQDLKQISSFFPDHRMPVSDWSDISSHPELWCISWRLIDVSNVCPLVVLVLESPQWKRSGSHDLDQWPTISEEVWTEVWRRPPFDINVTLLRGNRPSTRIYLSLCVWVYVSCCTST